MHPYEDILHLSRPVSQRHPPMPRLKRAAQFAPFVALTGHEDAIEETARITEPRQEIAATAIDQLNQQIAFLFEHLNENPVVTIKHFIPDKTKAGGAYQITRGIVKKINLSTRTLTLKEKVALSLDNIVSLICDRGEDSHS